MNVAHLTTADLRAELRYKKARRLKSDAYEPELERDIRVLVGELRRRDRYTAALPAPRMLEPGE